MSVPSSKITYTKEYPKSENPRTALTLGAPAIAVTIGYVTWCSMMSELLTQREYAMTWVSLRSGIASRATCFKDHHPATEASATRIKTTILFLTEKSMMRSIIPGLGHHLVSHVFLRSRVFCIPRRILAELSLAYVGTEIILPALVLAHPSRCFCRSLQD